LQSLPRPAGRPAGPADHDEPEPAGGKGSRAGFHGLPRQPQERGRNREPGPRAFDLPPRAGGADGGDRARPDRARLTRKSAICKAFYPHLNGLSDPSVRLPPCFGEVGHDGGIEQGLAVPGLRAAAGGEERGLRAGAALGITLAHPLRIGGGIRARGYLARVPRFAEAMPVRQQTRAEAGAFVVARAARSAVRRGGAAMTALICIGVTAVMAWAVARESGRRRRWREAERLSRCLFAAAGMRRYR